MPIIVLMPSVGFSINAVRVFNHIQLDCTSKMVHECHLICDWSNTKNTEHYGHLRPATPLHAVGNESQYVDFAQTKCGDGLVEVCPEHSDTVYDNLAYTGWKLLPHTNDKDTVYIPDFTLLMMILAL